VVVILAGPSRKTGENPLQSAWVVAVLTQDVYWDYPNYPRLDGQGHVKRIRANGGQ
jgi:hypothetical protein